VEIPPRHVHVYYGTDPPETHGPFLPPDWIDSRNVKPIDRITADALEPMIAPDRPITLSLQEALKDRRVDVRALASRCLAALDDYEAALTQLADPNQHSYWSAQFDALRQALSRSPETAAKVRETVNLQRPAHAKEIYRLLLGFSEEQVEKGAAADLVRFLEHEQMDVRVLAHLNLVSITGAWGFYRPERAPAQQKQAIQNWRDRLNKGTIVYRLPPSPLDTYRPAPAVSAEGKAEMEAGRGALKAEIDTRPARAALLRQMDETLFASEIGMSLVTTALEAMMVAGIERQNPGAGPEALEEYRRQMEPQRETMLDSMREDTLIAFAYTYRDMSDADLKS
jgi:hypothetical protein